MTWRPTTGAWVATSSGEPMADDDGVRIHGR